MSEVDYETLRAAVLAWWEEHKSDVWTEYDGGYCEEYNVYDEKPLFVRLAMEGPRRQSHVSMSDFREVAEVIKRGATAVADEPRYEITDAGRAALGKGK